MKENIAMVLSVNSKPKLRTVYSLNSTFAQCDCPISLQAMICKHVMKAFLMTNLGIEEGFIVREACTLYGVNKTTAFSKVFGYVPSTRPLLSVIEDKYNTTIPKSSNNMDFPKVLDKSKEYVATLESKKHSIHLSLDKSSSQASETRTSQKIGNVRRKS